MAKLSKIQLDPKAQVEGVWINYVLDIDVKIANMGNVEYDSAIRRLSKPFTRGFRADRIPDDVMQDITMKAVAEYIVKDWKNIEDDKGKPIKYSPKKALELFKDPANRDFYKFIIASANDIELFRLENLEDAKGN